MIAEDFRNACKLGNLKKAQEHFSENTLNAQNEATGDSALHLAVRHNQVFILGYLLGKNVDINIKNEKQQTPLMDALINGNQEISELLLDQDCDVICSDANGLNALQIAITYSKLSENAELINLIKSKIYAQAQRNPEKYGEIEIDKHGFIHNPVEDLRKKLKELSLDKKPVQDIYHVVTTEQLSEQMLLAARLKRVHAAFELVQGKGELMGWLGQQEADLPLRQTVKHKLGLDLEKADIKIQEQHDASQVDSQASWVIPNLQNAKPLKRSNYRSNPEESGKLLRQIEYWARHNVRSKIKIDAKKSQLISYDLHLPAGQEIKFQANDITHAKLILEGCVEKMEWKTNCAILHLKFSNKTTISFGLIMDKETHLTQMKETRITLEKLGAICSDEMHNLAYRDAGPWTGFVTFKRMLEVGKMAGENDLGNFYTSAHNLLARRVVEHVQAIHPQPRKITLFSFGCGTGDELLQTEKQLKNAQLTVEHAFGFDIAEGNFVGSPKSKTMTLKQGNIHALEQCLEGVQYNQDSFKVGMFIGVLTDKVMSGTKQALDTIQQTRNLDFIYIDGLNICLLNKTVLKSVGFFVEEFQVDDPNMKPSKEARQIRSFNRRYELRWMTPDERRYYLQKISTERSRLRLFDILDLSLSANPLNDLKLFSVGELKSLKTIDISWGYLKENEIQEFFAIIDSIKGSELNIVLSQQQHGYEKIHRCVSNFSGMSIVERLDSLNPAEIPNIPPRKAKEIGLYEHLPQVKIAKLTRK